MPFNSQGITYLKVALNVDNSGLANMLRKYVREDDRYKNSGQKFTPESIARWEKGGGSPPMSTVDALDSFAYEHLWPDNHIEFHIHPEGASSLHMIVLDMKNTLDKIANQTRP